MVAHFAKKSTKKVKKVKKSKRSIEEAVNPEQTKRIEIMAPIRRPLGSRTGETTTTTTSTNSPNVNINSQSGRKNNGFNKTPQRQQQNSRGEPSTKKGFKEEGLPYGKNNGHQNIPIPSGSQPQLRQRVTQPPVKSAEEQENQRNLMKEVWLRGSSQGSFDKHRIGNEQVTTNKPDPRTTMPTPTVYESTTPVLPPVTTTMTPANNLFYVYVVFGALFGIVVVGGVGMWCCGGFKCIGNWFRRKFGKKQTDDSPSPLPIEASSIVSPRRSFWDRLCFWKKREPTPEELVHPDKKRYKQILSRRIIPTERQGPSESQRFLNNESIGSTTTPEQLRDTAKDIMNKKNNEEQKHDDDADVKNYEGIMKQAVQDEESPSETEHHGYNDPSPIVPELGDTLAAMQDTGKESMQNEQAKPSQKSKKEQKADEDAAVKEYEDSLKRTVEDEEKSKKIHEKCENLEEDARRLWRNIKQQEEEHRNKSSNDVSDFAEADEMDRQFREKLAEQNREFAKKMEELKRQRKEKQRKADEEFQKLRGEMQNRLAAFLKCLQLKQRFGEKKEEWEEFLKKLRQLLVKIVNSYYDLQKEIKDFDPTDEISQSFVDSGGKTFAKKIANAQHMFSNAFNNLKALTEDYNDRIFIKMIMKSISKQAHLCNDVGEELVWVLEQKSKDIKKLDELVHRIDSQGIPTTGKLTKDSVHAREEDYTNIEDVPLAEWFRYFM